MSPRTLQRKLATRGTTFRRLLDAALRVRAERLLAESSLDIVEVAARMGFNDPGNFGRAFRRWTGSGPGTFRHTVTSRPKSGTKEGVR